MASTTTFFVKSDVVELDAFQGNSVHVAIVMDGFCRGFVMFRFHGRFLSRSDL